MKYSSDNTNSPEFIGDSTVTSSRLPTFSVICFVTSPKLTTLQPLGINPSSESTNSPPLNGSEVYEPRLEQRLRLLLLNYHFRVYFGKKDVLLPYVEQYHMLIYKFTVREFDIILINHRIVHGGVNLDMTKLSVALAPQAYLCL